MKIKLPTGVREATGEVADPGSPEPIEPVIPPPVAAEPARTTTRAGAGPG